MASVRQLLNEALKRLDGVTSVTPHDLAQALKPVTEEANQSGEIVPELHFEQLAAELYAYDENSVWDTHYGPWLSKETTAGRIDRPSLESISPDCIAYWSVRMRESKHPALRARYADLVWDLSLKATENKPPIEAAQLAIDGYVEAITTNRCEAFGEFGDVQARALLLAASVDVKRLNTGAAELRKFAGAAADSEERGRRQLELLDVLMRIGGKRTPTTELQLLAADLRVRLNELDAAKADKFIIGDVALALADYYWSTQLRDDAKDVIRIWGAAVKRLAAETTMSMLASAWLREAHEVYIRFEMQDDAEALVMEIEGASAGIEKELVRVSQTTTIPQEEFDKAISDLVSGTKDEVLHKLAVNCLPTVDDAEKMVKETASKTIFMKIPQEVVAEDGRVTASIGPIEDDLDGHVIQQLSRSIQFYGQIYRPAWEAAVAHFHLTADDIVAWLAKCPLFSADRLGLLKPAINAYLNGDWVTAIHVAIPQIEQALRQVLVHCGQPVIRPHRNGTFLLKILDEVLRDPTVEKALPRDVRVYLRTLLCDQRGLNIRNNVCHGLWDSKYFNWFVADRVIHALLVIGSLRASSTPGVVAPN